MIGREGSDSIEPVKNGFQSFEHAAADTVLAASFNPAGTRAALCSADHKIRIYSIGQDKEWSLLEQFRGHDAEVLDVSRIDLLSTNSERSLESSQDPMGFLEPRSILRYHWW